MQLEGLFREGKTRRINKNRGTKLMPFNSEESKVVVDRLVELIDRDVNLDKEDKCVSFSSEDDGIKSYYFDAPLNVTIKVFTDGKIGLRVGYDFDFDYLIVEGTELLLSKLSDLYETAKAAAEQKLRKKFKLV